MARGDGRLTVVGDRFRNVSARAAGLIRRGRDARLLAQWRSPRADDEFVAVLVFAGDQRQLYQAREWLWPLEQLAQQWREDGWGERPVGILCRDPVAARVLAPDTELPVRWATRTRDALSVLAACDLRIAFYPNQNTLNFQTLAAASPAHVHLSHGESEKASMTSNQLKAYDHVFAAGDAAVKRIQQDLIGFDAAKVSEVGRPQVDAPRAIPDWFPVSEQRTVLYAPTWEGDSPAMSYSSLLSAGERVVSALIDSGVRVLYRPHPQAGSRSTEYRAADRRIRALLKRGSGHIVDTSADFGWQWDVVDAAVVDMSAVAFEALAVGKPLVVIEPSPTAAVRSEGLLNDVPVVARDGAGVLEALLLAGSPEQAAQRERLARHHFGDVSPGSQIARFLAVSTRVAVERDGQLELR